MNDFEYRHLGRLTNVLMVLLLAGALVNAAASISSIMQIAMLNRGFTTEEAEASDLREGILGILQTVLFVATAIPFGMWIVRAHRNVRALSAVGLEISPGWALGYYFIPIANLWKPYQAMRDLWKASTNPPGWPAVRTGSVLVIWWIVWLLANYAGRIATRIADRAADLEGLRMASYANFASEVVNVLVYLLALAVVNEIASAQKQWMDRSAAPPVLAAHS